MEVQHMEDGWKQVVDDSVNYNINKQEANDMLKREY
jgi:hypothetical protein